jgi:hypothetical protein
MRMFSAGRYLPTMICLLFDEASKGMQRDFLALRDVRRLLAYNNFLDMSG